MPTYEYVCTDCGDDLEVVQSIHADSLTICPSCGGRLRKVFGNVGVVFKGSGFYKTDSRAEAKRSKRGRDDQGKDSDRGKDQAAAKAGAGGEGEGDKTSKPKVDKASTSDASGAGKSAGTDSGGATAKSGRPDKRGGHSAKGSKSGHK